jgi:hypothetical protein
MAIHVIALEKPNGSQRILEAGRECLLAHQDRAGHWTDPLAPDSVYLTVLVLDAIAMATGGNSLTFSPPALSRNDFTPVRHEWPPKSRGGSESHYLSRVNTGSLSSQ